MTNTRDSWETSHGGDTPTVIEQAERNPAAAREIAAARLAVNIGWALNAAVRARGWQAKRLAAELGIGESAVSQVLNGDGNLRVATIGRYARALGYQPRLVLEPVEAGLAPLLEPEPRRRRPARSHAQRSHRMAPPETGWRMVRASDGGVWAVVTTVSARGPDRVVQETEYTKLHPRSDDSGSLAGDPLLTAGGGA